MKNNFPKTPFLISVIFLLVFSFSFFYLFNETNKKVQGSESKEMEWQTEANKRNEIRNLNNSIKSIETERTQLETHFAQSSDVVPFLDTLEELARKVGADAEVVSVNIAEDHTGLLVGVKASGTFNNLYKFITLLENSSYELEFISMDIQKTTTSDTKGVNVPGWSANFSLKLLSFVE